MTNPKPESEAETSVTEPISTEPAPEATEPPPVAPPAFPVRRPPSNVGWAVASLLVFWPLAFSAFTHALNVFPLWSEGDAEGAQHASHRARWLGIVSLCVGGALIVLFGALYLILLIVMIHHGHHHHGFSGGQPPRMRRG
ncbi:CD225/dispanin family protein [Nocardia sp. NPDC006630]|uniref:CD225/dispanin family protein n=1 Tax=Nocardia sp. NPDC006630 TaxID=3157181 RepID=UPI0033AA4FAD